MSLPTDVSDDFREKYIDLASPRLGAEVTYATDDFFADKSRLIDPAEPVFIADKYDDNGKWMDGWESRRKRGEGYDFCVVRLGLPGIIRGVDIDTSHFTGNYPPAASIDACLVDGEPDDTTVWTEILPSVSLKGDSHHLHAISNAATWSHLRLNIYPDGGVARLRVYGEVQCHWARRDPDEIIDLAALVNGGRGIAASDQHYGSPSQILAPGRGVNMGDGWETRRRREPGNDWALIALGHPGAVSKIEVDTAHFKGNYPDRCSIQGALVTGGTEQSLVTQSMFWKTLLPEQKLSMDAIHHFEAEVQSIGPISHVRINIIPDGGISRLRLFGRIAR
ncbi:allantoicase [Sneathiella chungangensis]|uniref:Probable allantoicase n=1 Tax=Sneathiella chungangensis TaxID=1418234 RepID=A0A845MDA4_9PROT|nr:allantoicase [Sneathiella chungangensis]MZR21958.1 allantoicase [Sneathiella chungangensis]